MKSNRTNPGEIYPGPEFKPCIPAREKLPGRIPARILSAVLALTLSFLPFFSGRVFAAGGASVPEGMSTEAYEALYDRTIGWDEISDIIIYRNPTYVLVKENAGESIRDLQDAVSDDIITLKSSLDEANSAINSIKNEEKAFLAAGGSQTGTAYNILEQSLETARSLRSSIKSSLSSMGSTSRSLKYSAEGLDGTLSSVRYQLEAAVKTLIITYKSLEVNAGMVDAEIDLYSRLYESAVSMEALGLGTASDTAACKISLEGALGSREVLGATLDQLKGNILVLCGYGEGETDVVIADLPAADREYLSGRDIEADRNRAISGNPAVISAESVSGYTGDIFKYRDANLSAVEVQAAAAFNGIYSDLASQVLIAESSEISLRKAEIMSESAGTKLDLGLIGSGEYAALELQYIAAKAANDLNELNLHQAITNYSYALKGVMSVE